MLKALMAFLAGEPATKPPHVEVFQGRKKKWFVRTVGANGEIVGPSQAYANKSNAVRAGQARIDHAPKCLFIKDTAPPIKP